MQTKNCKKCGKELTQTEGRRAKQFCNSNCRSTFWQNKNKKVVKPVIEDSTEQTNEKTTAQNESVNTSQTPTMPQRKDFSDNWAYLEAKSIWKELTKEKQD